MRWLPVSGSRCEGRAGMCISGRHGWHLILKRRNFTCPQVSMQSSLHKRSQRDRRRAATSAAEEGGMVLGPYEQLFTQPTLKDVTYPTDLLCASEVLDRMALVQPSHADDCYLAFYSSELGGITTTPALMMVAIDDHMVHRGHAVFDTAIVVDGHLYQLRQHFDRLLRSAEKARIPLPMPREQMWRTILETTAAGKRNNAFVRYWLSAGRGGFGLSSDECNTSSFYVMVYIRPDQVEADQSVVDLKLGRLAERGLSVCTSSIPQKPAMFATMKTNNYLPNALALLEAQDKGLDQGIFVDAEGWISEGPAVNVGIITQSDTLVVPPFDTSLDGITIQRVMELIPTFQDSGDLEDFVAGGVERRPVHIDEVFEAKEVFITSSSAVVLPVVRWDDRAINDGEPGEQTLALKGMLEYDMDPANETGQHIPVPYGFLTGMEDEDYVY